MTIFIWPDIPANADDAWWDAQNAAQDAYVKDCKAKKITTVYVAPETWQSPETQEETLRLSREINKASDRGDNTDRLTEQLYAQWSTPGSRCWVVGVVMNNGELFTDEQRERIVAIWASSMAGKHIQNKIEIYDDEMDAEVETKVDAIWFAKQVIGIVEDRYNLLTEWLKSQEPPVKWVLPETIVKFNAETGSSLSFMAACRILGHRPQVKNGQKRVRYEPA